MIDDLLLRELTRSNSAVVRRLATELIVRRECEELNERWMIKSFHLLRDAIGKHLAPASAGTADWALRELRKLEIQCTSLSRSLASARVELHAYREDGNGTN